MLDEKWEDLVSRVEEKFGVLRSETIEDNLIDDRGNVFSGTKDILIFNGIQGKIKLERVNHPRIEDKKMHYHKGSGGVADIEYQVSETETTHRLKAYLWDEASNDWKEIEIPSGTMKF